MTYELLLDFCLLLFTLVSNKLNHNLYRFVLELLCKPI